MSLGISWSRTLWNYGTRILICRVSVRLCFQGDFHMVIIFVPVLLPGILQLWNMSWILQIMAVLFSESAMVSKSYAKQGCFRGRCFITATRNSSAKTYLLSRIITILLLLPFLTKTGPIRSLFHMVKEGIMLMRKR